MLLSNFQYPAFDDTTDYSQGGGDYSNSNDSTTPAPTDAPYDPYAAGDYNNPTTGQYDPTLDPNNYDPQSGQYYGPGAYTPGDPLYNPNAPQDAPNAPGKSNSSSGGSSGGGASKTAAAGKAAGDAAQAAANQRMTAGEFAVKTNQSNISGQSAFENELLNRAKLEDTQRKEANKDVWRQGYFANGTGAKGPYDTQGPPQLSPSVMANLATQGQQGSQKLATPAQYGTGNMPALAPYTPMDPTKFTTPGTLEKVGSAAGFVLPLLDAFGNPTNQTPSTSINNPIWGT